jgi:DNA repair protein RadC
MDDRLSCHERGDPSCHDDRTGSGIESLCSGAGVLGLSDVSSAIGGCAQPSSSATIGHRAPQYKDIAARHPDICGRSPLTRPPEAATGEAELARILSPLFADIACDVAVDDNQRHAGIPPAASALATRLIAEFGSLTALLAARPETVRRLLGPDEQPQRIADFLAWLGDGFVTALRFEIQRAPILSDSKALIDYLHMTMACETAEQFRVFFLDSARRLIRDEQMGIGSLTATAVSPREIVKRALELGATSLILVHNHPSGDTRPSPGDIEMTAMIVRAARCLEIAVTDHIIIARTGWTSLRSLGML